MARSDEGIRTGSDAITKNGDPTDQGTRAKGLDYDRGPQDKERGNDGVRGGQNKVLTRENGGKVTNGHGRW